MTQKGFTPIIVALIGILVIALVGGAYYLGTQSHNAPSLQTDKIIEPTPAPTASSQSSPQPSTSPNATDKPVSNAIKITYKLPTGWQTIQDPSKRLEVGYDQSKYDAMSDGNKIWLSGKWVGQGSDMHRLGGSQYFYITPYSGGSRHTELYKLLGIQDGDTGWKMPKYAERDYILNSWNCLIMNGISISQYPVTWGYCPVSTSEAIVLEFDNNDWSQIEQQLATVKLLK